MKTIILSDCARVSKLKAAGVDLRASRWQGLRDDAAEMGGTPIREETRIVHGVEPIEELRLTVAMPQGE